MLKIINLNVILLSLAIAYGILKIINFYNNIKMEYSVGSEESLPEQISLADIADKLAEWWPPSDELNVEKDMTDELNAEKDMTEYDNDFFRKFILRFSFRYRFDRCVYKETEDESCKNGAVDLGIDKICCNIRVWNFKDDIYYNHVPNSNITINDKTYEHDFIDCVDGKYNSNGYYHINQLEIDCEKVLCGSINLHLYAAMKNNRYWLYQPNIDTDFSCKLNVSRIDHAPGSISIHTKIDDHTAQISNIDEWNHHVFLKNSFRYRFDNCVYKETEDESCKNGAVDLGIDNICCDIIAWDHKYMNYVPNSNITIDDKTYKHDFIDCVGGKYNSNGYYHINKFKIDCEKVVCTVKRYFHSGMDYWFLPVDTDFSCKLNVSRIDHAPGSTYIGRSFDPIEEPIWGDVKSNVQIYMKNKQHIPSINNWGDFHIPPVDLGGSISLHDEWNDEAMKDYIRRAKYTPDAISEKFETEELDFGDEDL